MSVKPYAHTPTINPKHTTINTNPTDLHTLWLKHTQKHTVCTNHHRHRLPNPPNSDKKNSHDPIATENPRHRNLSHTIHNRWHHSIPTAWACYIWKISGHSATEPYPKPKIQPPPKISLERKNRHVRGWIQRMHEKLTPCHEKIQCRAGNIEALSGLRHAVGTVVKAIEGVGIGSTCPCGISIDGKFWGSKKNRCGEGSLVRWDEREGEKTREQNPRPANKEGRHEEPFTLWILFPALCPAHCPMSPGQLPRAALHGWEFIHKVDIRILWVSKPNRVSVGYEDEYDLWAKDWWCLHKLIRSPGDPV